MDSGLPEGRKQFIVTLRVANQQTMTLDPPVTVAWTDDEYKAIMITSALLNIDDINLYEWKEVTLN